jgi:hypothetical protein
MQVVMTSDEMAALREVDRANSELRARNEARLAEFKAAMGSKFLLHSDNAPVKHAYKAVLNHAQE